MAFWKQNRDVQLILKNAVNFLVASIHKMNFQVCFFSVFVYVKAGHLKVSVPEIKPDFRPIYTNPMAVISTPYLQ